MYAFILIKPVGKVALKSYVMALPVRTQSWGRGADLSPPQKMLRWTSPTSGRSGWRTPVPVRMRQWRVDAPLCSLSTPVEHGLAGVTQKTVPFRPCIRRKTESCSACERRESVWVGALGACRPGWTGFGDDDGDDGGGGDDGVVWMSCALFHLGAPTGPPGCAPWEERVRASGSAVGGSSLRYSVCRPVRGDTGVSESSHRNPPSKMTPLIRSPLRMLRTLPLNADAVSDGIRDALDAEQLSWSVRRIAAKRSSIRFWGAWNSSLSLVKCPWR